MHIASWSSPEMLSRYRGVRRTTPASEQGMTRIGTQTMRHPDSW